LRKSPAVTWLAAQPAPKPFLIEDRDRLGQNLGRVLVFADRGQGRASDELRLKRLGVPRSQRRAANRQGLFTSEPLRVAFGDGWRLEAIDEPIKTAALAAKPPVLPLPGVGTAEPDGRRAAAKGHKGPEAADPGAVRFFKRITTMAVKPGLYRVFGDGNSSR